MKNNLEEPKGKTQVNYNLSFQQLSSLATKTGLEVNEAVNDSRSCVDCILEDNVKRNNTFSESCSFIGCASSDLFQPSLVDLQRKSVQGASAIAEGNIGELVVSVKDHTAEGSVISKNLGGVLEAEPSTPVKSDGDSRNPLQLADLIEDAWTKVGIRKKYRRRK